MTDKKIVDDYYLQPNTNNSDDVNNAQKKQKLTIKWKIKPKVENKISTSLTEEKIEPKINIEEKKEKKQKIFKPTMELPTIKEEVKKEENKIEKIPKKYFDKNDKSLNKQDSNINRQNNFNNSNKQNNTSTFNNKQNTSSVSSNKFNSNNNRFKNDSKTDVEKKLNVNNKQVFNKISENQNTERKQFTKNDSVDKQNASKFFNKKPWKIVNKEITDNKPKKQFKKDKSSKYAKSIILEEDDFSFSRSNKIKQVKKEEKKVEDMVQNLTDRTWETVIVHDILSVKELSEKIWIPLMKLITEFMKNWMMVNLNSKVDYDTASIISEAFQIKLQKDMSAGFWVEDLLTWNIWALLQENDKSLLIKRPPIISIMWHVDHWKTSLLDYIRKTKVADKEAWGITQSIWAYQVEYNWELITFLDTPWHEAFTIMRARWAKSTDIAILVVAADEWVKPQTIESINHAREAWLKIVVAITKIDKPGANLDNVKTWLSIQWLLSEDWWGDIPMVWVSSKSWEWIDNLLEIILLVSEMEELKANPNRAAVGTILESHLDVKLWPVSTVLINTWTLKKWDSIVCKWSYWKVKVLKDCLLKNIDSAWPSSPVLVVWLDSVADGWDIVQVVSDVENARLKALEYKELMSSKKSLQSSSIDLIMSKIKSWNLKQLKIVVKADTNWSLEAIKWALLKLSTSEIKVTIIHSWVWNITEWDVLMCQWSSALLIWFNVELLWNTRNIISDTKVEYISSKIIYHITDRVEKIVTWMLDPKEVEISLWNAIVWGIFYEWEWFMILWLKLKSGWKIEKNATAKIIRKDKFLWNWKIENLKSWVIDVVDIEWPVECWIKLKTDVKIEMWDELEIFKIEIQK